MVFWKLQICLIVLILLIDNVKGHPCPCDCKTPDKKIGCTIIAKARPDSWGPIRPPFDNSIPVDIFKNALRNRGVSEVELKELFITEGYRKVDQEVHYCFKFKIPPSNFFNVTCEMLIQYVVADRNHVRIKSTTCPIEIHTPDEETSTPRPTSLPISSSHIILYQPTVILLNGIFILSSQILFGPNR